MSNVQNLSSYVNPRRGIGTVPVIAACCGVTAVSLGLWVVESRHLSALDRDRTQTAEALNQAKLQIQDLTGRLNTLQEKSRVQEADRAVVPPAAPSVSVANRKKRAPAPARDPRVDKLQGQLGETQKQLASTREDLAKAQQDLDGKIASTRDDLNGSIAKTHDEVAALQRRGELNIYEFKLTKSKDPQRVGPLSLSLRGTNTKHKTYDLSMVVDDNSLAKKHVNLYEPVWITLSDRPQAVQLVVNRVGKNEIEGYVSEPKYKKSELATNSTTPEQNPQPALSTR